MVGSVHRATRKGVPAAGDGAPPFTIRVKDLQHSFGEGELRKQVLFDNALEIARGEIVIMTGPSGSGKTTLLTLIGTLRTVQQGSLKIMDRELRGAGAGEIISLRRQLGFIFQQHNLFESLTAYQNVRMATELVGMDQRTSHDQILQLLGQLGLEGRVHYKPGALSGGQKQRVAIARGLVHQPRIVLADEPTAALDEESGRAAMELLHKLAKDQGATVIIVTHDNRILDFADRLVSMVDGRIKSDVMVKEAAKICEYLQSSTIFSKHAISTLTHVADKMLVEQFQPGQIVIRQGDPGDKFYLIRSGRVDVIVEDEQGKRVVNQLGEGEYFGETALLTDEPRNATVMATEPSVFYTLEKEDFQAVVAQSPTFEEELRRAIFDRQ